MSLSYRAWHHSTLHWVCAYAGSSTPLPAFYPICDTFMGFADLFIYNTLVTAVALDNCSFSGTTTPNILYYPITVAYTISSMVYKLGVHGLPLCTSGPTQSLVHPHVLPFVPAATTPRLLDQGHTDWVLPPSVGNPPYGLSLATPGLAISELALLRTVALYPLLSVFKVDAAIFDFSSNTLWSV